MIVYNIVSVIIFSRLNTSQIFKSVVYNLMSVWFLTLNLQYYE